MMETNLETERENIVVTGFGLFRDHQLNPSWEAIKDNQLKIGSKYPNLNIIAKQIDVSYEDVDRLVSELWLEFKPILMVHVGLAAFEKSIRIEEIARHGPYIDPDVRKFAPHEHLREYHSEERMGSSGGDKLKRPYSCKPCEFGSVCTRFNVDEICDKMNKLYASGELALGTKKSTDAGLYVCEYIYKTSLKMNQNCLFIHVPNISKDFTLDSIRLAIQQVIEFAIEQLKS